MTVGATGNAILHAGFWRFDTAFTVTQAKQRKPLTNCIAWSLNPKPSTTIKDTKV